MPVNEQFKYVYLPAWRAMAHCFVGDGEYESVCRSNTIASNYYLFAIVNSTGSAWPCARIYHQHPHPHQLSNIVDRIGAMHSNRLFIFFFCSYGTCGCTRCFPSFFEINNERLIAY